MTSNGIGLMAVILRYLAEIGRFGGAIRQTGEERYVKLVEVRTMLSACMMTPSLYGLRNAICHIEPEIAKLAISQFSSVG